MKKPLLPNNNFVMIGLDSGTASAIFASGINYHILPFLDVYVDGLRTPENLAKVVYQQRQGKQLVLERQYKDLNEASYDSELPSVAKYLLQGLIGIPI